MQPHSPEQTRVHSLLQRLQRGDDAAARELLPFVYEELRQRAASELAKEPLIGRNGTLQPTALVHEAYMKLVSGAAVDWQDRKHFFAAAAIAIRRILIDRARKRSAAKHGGGRARVDMGEQGLAQLSKGEQSASSVAEDRRWEAVHNALEKLQLEDPELAEIVNLRYFAGLTTQEVAWALDVSTKTIDRRWNVARAWLIHELGDLAQMMTDTSGPPR
jgi:RNA polymerase sigma factor (TIGR02999 family)